MVAPIPVAVVSVGKIARDQHLPAIAADPDFVLAAAVSRHATVEGVPNYPDLATFLRDGPEAAVALCAPPAVRTEMALQAIAAGRDVLLEKPPAATLGEAEAIAAAAREAGVVLFATWHSRFAPAVEAARQLLAARKVRSARIVWKEDVRAWHPGQDWIWETGGFGIFDTGINALSILTEILPGPAFVEAARLHVPGNRAMPIAADLEMNVAGVAVTAEMDWRQEGLQTWDIALETDAGPVMLGSGGATLDGAPVAEALQNEYPAIYRRFAALARARKSDVDLAPLRIVADAFLVGERRIVENFDE